ncbi:MAG: hypothetical protein ACP5N2_00525 [Candidatus Nanoarchaeia archaeon]
MENDVEVLVEPKKKEVREYFEPLPFVKYAPEYPKVPDDIAAIVGADKPITSHIDGLTRFQVIQGGYSGAVVLKTPRAKIKNLEQSGMWKTYTVEDLEVFVYKDNGDEELNNLELKIYEKRAALGFPTPKIMTPKEAQKIAEENNNPHAAKIGQLKGFFLEDMATDLYTFSQNCSFKGKKGLDKLYDVLMGLTIDAAKDSLAQEKILSEEEVSYFHNKQLSSLKNKFKLDESFLDENFFLYRMLECVPGATPEMALALAPIASNLKEAMKYKVVNTDPSERNIFIKNDDDPTHADFNSNDWMPAVYSITKLLSSPLPFEYCTSALNFINRTHGIRSDIADKIIPASYAMIVSNLTKLYEEKFKNTNETQYDVISSQLDARNSCELFATIRHTRHTLDELAKAPAAVPEQDAMKAWNVLHWFTVMHAAAIREGPEFYSAFVPIEENYARNIVDVCSGLVKEYEQDYRYTQMAAPDKVVVLKEEVEKYLSSKE